MPCAGAALAATTSRAAQAQAIKMLMGSWRRLRNPSVSGPLSTTRANVRAEMQAQHEHYM
jgi:hypothetical protein